MAENGMKTAEEPPKQLPPEEPAAASSAGSRRQLAVSSPGFVASVHQVFDVHVGGDSQLGQVLHVRAHQRVFSDTQVSSVMGLQ